MLLPLLCRPDRAGSLPVVEGKLSMCLDGGVGTLSEAIDNLLACSNASSWYAVKTVQGLVAWIDFDGRGASRALILDRLVEPFPLGGVMLAVPSSNQLLVVCIDTIEKTAVIPMLVHAAKTAYGFPGNADPVSPSVFWHYGKKIYDVTVNEGEDTIEIVPPKEFVEVVEKLAALKLFDGAAAEA